MRWRRRPNAHSGGGRAGGNVSAAVHRDARTAGSHASPADGYAGPTDAYTRAADGHAYPADGYRRAADGHASAADGYAGAAYGYRRAADGHGSPAYGHPVPLEPAPDRVTQPGAFSKWFVDAALARYEEIGREAAIDYFNSMEGVEGQWYISMADENGAIIAHPTIKDNIGRVLAEFPGYVDANDGTHFGRELATAGTSGKWVDYTYINPATGNEERKRSWIKRKDDLLFLTGWYSVEDTTTPADRDANPGLYAKQLVADAVAYYDENGADAATSYYNSDESMDGEWYVAIFGPDGKMIAHPDAALLGREHTSFVDSKGKEFGKDLAAATGDGVWVDYIFANPATGYEEQKYSWAVLNDGHIFVSGWYTYAGGNTAPRHVTPGLYAKSLVNNAIARYERDGLDAAVAYAGSDAGVDGEWYVVVVGPDGKLLNHPNPDNVGRHIETFVDSNGKEFGKEIAAATEEGAWVDYIFANPDTGLEEQKYRWAIKRGEYIFVSGWHSIGGMVGADARPEPGAYAQTLVSEAIIWYTSEGVESAVAHYGSDAGIDGAWYVAIFGPDGKLLNHPNPDNVGREVTSFVDSEGKRFGEDIAATSEEGVWVDYLFANPATGQEEQKYSWTALHDGHIFVSGWYTVLPRSDAPDRRYEPGEYTKWFVEQALAYYDANGRDATIEYYNTTEHVVGEWYMIIMDENDKIVSHATIPDRIGDDAKDPKFTDANGVEYGKEILKSDESGRWVNFIFPNPAKGGREENKHLWAIKRGGLLFMSGWYSID